MEIRINLIPPYRKEKIAQTKRWRLVLRVEAVISLILGLFLLFLFGLGSFLDISLKAVSNFQDSSSEKVQYEKVNKMDRDFDLVNSQIGDILAIKEDQMYWSRLLIEMSASIIPGIEIGEIASKNFNIILTGKSDSRDDLIKFKEKLESNGCFSDVNLPLSNLVSKENIDFQIDFKIKDECLHK